MDEALPESISGILISSDDEDVEEEGESSSDYDNDDFQLKLYIVTFNTYHFFISATI